MHHVKGNWLSIIAMNQKCIIFKYYLVKLFLHIASTHKS